MVFHQYNCSAIVGHQEGRHWLGWTETYVLHVGNKRQGLEHFLRNARCGHDGTLDEVRNEFLERNVTKDEYAKLY